MNSGLTLLTGDDASALSAELLGLYCQRAAEGEECLWIAPNRPGADAVRNAVARRAKRAILAPRIMTFTQLANRIIERSGQRICEVGPLASRRLLQTAVRQTAQAGELTYHGPIAESPGFVAMVARTIAEWKRRDIWPELLIQSVMPRPQRELALAYRRYQQLLHATNRYDAEGQFWAARDILKQSPELLESVDLSVVDGFADFTAAQYDILEQIAQQAGSTVISLMMDDIAEGDETSDQSRSDLFDKPCAAFKRLRPFANHRRCRTAGNGPAVFVHLRNELLRDHQSRAAPSAAVVQSAKRIEVVAANSAQSELVEVARRVEHLLNIGEPPESIVVSMRRPAELAERVGSVCADFGLPAFVDHSRRLAESPVVRLLTSLLRLHAEDWPSRDLLALVDNNLVRLSDDVERESPQRSQSERGPELTVDLRAAVERAIRRERLPSGRDELIARLQMRAGVQECAEALSSDVRVELAEAVEDRTKYESTAALHALKRLGETFSRLPQAATVCDWIAAVEVMLRRLMVQCRAAGLRPHSHWQQLKQGLLEIARIDEAASAVESLSLEQFMQLALSTANQRTLPQDGDGVDCVRFVGAEAARVLHFKHLFIIGLSERSFVLDGPSLGGFDEPLTTSNVETSAANVADLLAEVNDDSLLFYQLVTRPTESLTLSYPALDDKAQPLPPSPLLVELQHRLDGCKFRRTELPLGEHLNAPHRESSATERRQGAVAQLLAGDAGPVAWLDEPLREPILGGLTVIADRANRDAFGRFEGLLDGTAARSRLTERFGGDHLWSPSQLETYAECPFLFYADFVLQLEPLEEFTLDDDIRTRGSLLHETLARMHRHIKTNVEASTTFDLDCIETAFRQAAEEVLDGGPTDGLPRALREIQRRQIEAWCAGLVQQFERYASQWKDWDAPPTPEFFEARFGPGSARRDQQDDEQIISEDPFRLGLSEEVIQLTGQIDRIDAGTVNGAKAINIIDYKSGGRRLNHAQIEDGRQLQLPLYAMAAEELLFAEREATVMAAGYWNVRDAGFGKASKSGGQLRLREPGDRGREPTKQWEDLQTAMLQRIEEIVAGVRRGDFPVFNEDDQCTSRCHLRTICRIGQIRSLDKGWTTPPDEQPA